MSQVFGPSKRSVRLGLLMAAAIGVWFIVSNQQPTRHSAHSATRNLSERHDNRDQTRVRALLVALRSSRRETGIDERLTSSPRLTGEPFAGANTPAAWFCEITVRSFTIDSPAGFQGCSDLSVLRSRAPPIS